MSHNNSSLENFEYYCPTCNSILTQDHIKVFGPFFRGGGPEYSYAIECPNYCFRGALKSSKIEVAQSFEFQLDNKQKSNI